ncbi:beta-ketoacyl synthase N-terminal-like domain-containing protein [Streptomyces sp. MS1.AVA.1]|uniref:Beta-ketoacyl synthase N-terminal-like domain-containing protein n=1 Tax=Streptomyces machairae TaxID=3134109 RepID=A0ABU8UHD3_9ACTN
MTNQHQSESMRTRRAQSEAIAVVGLSCRLPGAGNPEAFWDLLSTGTSAITPVPGTAGRPRPARPRPHPPAPNPACATAASWNASTPSTPASSA